jgi:nitric oxide dioxygenase
VSDLERPTELRATVTQLALRHNDYGVKVTHYDTVGEALVWAIVKSMGRQATPELRAAWVEFYGMVSAEMKPLTEE